MTAELLLLALRVLVGTTFLLAVAAKAADRDAFSQGLTSLTGLRASSARVAAAGVLVTEALLAATLLAWPGAARPAFAVATVVLLVFSAVLVSALRRTYRPSCNCFGASARPLSAWDLARNGLLVAACLWGMALTPAGAPAPQPGLLVLVVLPAVALGLVLSHLHDVATTLRRPLVHPPTR